MSTTFDLVGIGELIVDFTQVGTSETGHALYERNPGGAPANALATAAQLGLSCAFIGKVGADEQGEYLKSQLAASKVGDNGLLTDVNSYTTMAFVQVDPATGERSFSFARKPGADTQLRPEEVNLDLVRNCRALHVGSVSLTCDPVRSATIFAVDQAEEAGALISFDLNYRPGLWANAASAADEMSDMLSHADMVKMNAEEAKMVYDTSSLEDAAYATLARGPRFVAVTLGKEGAYLATRSASAYVSSVEARAVDTTGAGDVFWGATLAWLLGTHAVRTSEDLDSLTQEDLEACGRYACAAASVSTERRGAIPSIPTASEVAERIARG